MLLVGAIHEQSTTEKIADKFCASWKCLSTSSWIHANTRARNTPYSIPWNQPKMEHTKFETFVFAESMDKHKSTHSNQQETEDPNDQKKTCVLKICASCSWCFERCSQFINFGFQIQFCVQGKHFQASTGFCRRFPKPVLCKIMRHTQYNVKNMMILINMWTLSHIQNQRFVVVPISEKCLSMFFVHHEVGIEFDRCVVWCWSLPKWSRKFQNCVSMPHDHENIPTLVSLHWHIFETRFDQALIVTSWRFICKAAGSHTRNPTSSTYMCFNFCKDLRQHINNQILWGTLDQRKLCTLVLPSLST